MIHMPFVNHLQATFCNFLTSVRAMLYPFWMHSLQKTTPVIGVLQLATLRPSPLERATEAA